MSLIGYNLDAETFDAIERQVEGRLDIYLDGNDAEPLQVLRSNYLIDYEIIEEASAEAQNPLGAISANELSFTLTNLNNMFSPTYVNGPYFGKIKVGVKVTAWLRALTDSPEEDDWLPMGTFYVSDWTANLGAQVASVICVDEVQNLLVAPVPDLDIQLNPTYRSWLIYILNEYGYTNISVDTELNTVIPYGFYVTAETRQLMQLIVEASMAVLISDRNGNLAVRKLRKQDPPAAVWTDSDQLFTLSSAQSIIKNYNGVKITYSMPQISDYREILDIESFYIPGGTTTYNTIKYPEAVFEVSAVTIQGEKTAYVQGYTSTNFGIRVTIRLPGAEGMTGKFTVTGRGFDLIDQEISDAVVNMVEVENVYIQTSAYADMYYNFLDKYVSADIPILEVELRGNPLLEIGDTVHVSSTRYGVEFDGIIIRMTYSYDGGLRCKASLLNAEVVS